MTNEEARKILEQLVMGSNPVNGEELPESHVLSQGPVIRAICMGIRALRQADEPEETRRRVKEKKRANAGGQYPAWTEAEIQCLRRMRARNMTEEEMARQIGRSAASLRATLRWLEREEQGALPDGREKAGTRWTQEDHFRLEALFKKRVPLEKIARELQRSEYAIFCRMERFGLCAEAEGYPRPEDNEACWRTEDGRTLRRLVGEGKSLAEIAAYFDRSEENMRARMFFMGLSREAPQSCLPRRGGSGHPGNEMKEDEP